MKTNENFYLYCLERKPMASELDERGRESILRNKLPHRHSLVKKVNGKYDI